MVATEVARHEGPGPEPQGSDVGREAADGQGYSVPCPLAKTHFNTYIALGVTVRSLSGSQQEHD